MTTPDDPTPVDPTATDAWPPSADLPPPAVSAAPAPPRPSTDTARWGRHPAVRVVTLAFGGLLTILVLTIGGLGVANGLVRTSDTDSLVLDGPVRRVEIRVDGRVSVQPGPADEATVSWRATFGLERPDVTTTLDDGLLTVRVRCGEGISLVCDTRVELAVPPDASLSVEGLGVEVRDIDGDVDVDSGAGEVELTRLSGRIDASVGGGTLLGRDLTSDEVRASTGAGTVEIDFDRAPHLVEAVAGAGAVIIGLPPGDETYRVDAEAATAGRSVDVRTDPTSDRVIRAHAGAGAVEVRYRA